MRRKHLLRAGLVGLAGAVGCNRQAVQPGTTPPMFGAAASSKFDPTTIPQQPAAPAIALREAPKKAAAPLRPDTEVALADNLVQDAFQETFEQVSAQTAASQNGEVGTRPKYSKPEQDKMLDTARQRYQRALATDPSHKGALLGLARLYAGAGDTDRAVQTLQLAAKAHPQDLELVVKLAKAQIAAGTFPAAEQTARYALTLDRESRDALMTLGVATAHQGNWQAAGEALMAAQMPEADAHYFLARVRLDRGDAEGGRKQLQLSLAANPKHPGATQIAAQLDAGRAAPPLPAGNPVMSAGYTEQPR